MPGYVYRGKDRLGGPPRRLIPPRAPAPPRAQQQAEPKPPEAPTAAPVPAPAVNAPALDLKPRQVDILTLAAEGKRNAEIAAALFLSEDTVKTYLRWANQTLGTPDRAAAVAAAMRAKVIHPQLASELPPVTAREVQVLAAIADGLSNTEAGERIGASGLTVKSHLARISRRWLTGQRAQLVALAIHTGVIS